MDNHYMGIPSNESENKEKSRWTLSYNWVVGLIIVGLVLLGLFVIVFAAADEIGNCSSGVCQVK